jgi:pyruvate dehydrogenase (quinone)
MMEQCDTLLMVGAGFPYTEYLPKEGQARGVQIDIDPAMLGLRYPMELNLVGDARATLAALLPLLAPRPRRARLARRDRARRGPWWRALEARAMVDADPINPQRVFWELSPRLPDGCIVCGDVGSTTYFYARDVKLPPRDDVVAVRRARVDWARPSPTPWRPSSPIRSAARAGDRRRRRDADERVSGLIDVAKYWKRWADPRLVVMVLNNRDLNFVTWEQRVTEGNPKFSGSQDLPDFAYADYARLLGLDGVRVERPEDVGPAWERRVRGPTGPSSWRCWPTRTCRRCRRT